MVFAVLLVERTEYNHQRDLDFSLVVDLSSLLLLPLVFVSVIGAAAAGSMLVYAIVWFIVFNYFMWESIYELKD
jgi:phosphatidylserine synthase